jgi:hypothetical protein
MTVMKQSEFLREIENVYTCCDDKLLDVEFENTLDMDDVKILN